MPNSDAGAAPKTFHGPIEDAPWAEKLTACVVSTGDAPRIHGYCVDDDLAENYGHLEQLFLTLTGILPDAATGKALRLSTAFISAATVDEGPSWTAVTARLINGRPSRSAKSAAAAAVLASKRPSCWIQSAVIVLIEEAQWHVDRLFESIEALIESGDATPAEVPEILRAADDIDAGRALALRDALARHDGPAPPDQLGLIASVGWLWSTLGLNEREHWIALWVSARIGAVIAEAMTIEPGIFIKYPTNTPVFHYTEEK